MVDLLDCRPRWSWFCFGVGSRGLRALAINGRAVGTCKGRMASFGFRMRRETEVYFATDGTLIEHG
jgi:hypothetical protein